MKNKGTNLLFSTDEELQKYYNTSFQLEKERFANIFGAIEEEPEEEINEEDEFSSEEETFQNNINIKLIKKYKRLLSIFIVSTSLSILIAVYFALKFFAVI